MPPVLGAVIAIGAAIGTALTTSLVVKALITVAATVLTAALRKKPKDVNRLNQGSELATKIDPTMPRQVLTGKIATGGSVHFTHTRTNDNAKPNRYLYRVIQISDQPINSLVKVMDGPDQITFAGDVTTGWRAANGYRSESGAACLWMRVYKGSFSATADATLVSETGGLWTNSHKGTGLAYAIVKMDSDPNAFPAGEPEFVFIVEGAKCYDDRKDSTVTGGSGSHRLNDYNTWEYTDTASIIAAQFFRGFYINGVRIVGVGADERDLATSMLFSAHNTSEQSVTISTGTEKRYAASMIMSADEEASEILIDLQAAMDGKIYDRGGSITILPGAIRTPVLNLTEEDIVWSEERSWQPHAQLEGLTNCITANYIDEASNFQEADLPVLKNAQWELDDGGERFITFYSFRAVTRRTQGQRITKRLHLASRYTGVFAFVGGIWLLEMEQGDWFTMTSPRYSFVSKYFEILDILITKDLRVAIIAQETDPDIDVWDHSVDEVPRDDDTWNPPAYDLPVPDIYYDEYVLTHPSSGHQTFHIDVGLVDPTRYGGFVKYVEVEVWRTGDTEPYTAGQFSVDRKKITISGLAPNVLYQVRARTSDGSRFSAWTDWVDATTTNATRIVAGQIDYVDPDTSALTPVQTILETTLQDIQDAFELAAAKGRLFFRATAPSISESFLGDTWIDNNGVFHDRVNEGGILLGGFAITLGGFRPFIAWTPAAVQPLANTLALANQAYEDANEAIDGLIGLADDGILTKNEKITKLIPEYARLEAKWAALTNAAATLGTSTGAASTARSNWNSFLFGLTPAWNDHTRDTPVSRTSYDTYRNAYDDALYQLDKNIKAAGKALTDAAQSSANLAQIQADAAYDAANDAIDALADLADDGILTINEKITKLIPEQARLEAKWSALSSAAATVGASTAAASTARGNWNSFLAGLSPAWNNTSADTLVTRSTYNSLRDAYDNALAALAANINTILKDDVDAAQDAADAAQDYAENGLNPDGTVKPNKVVASSLDGSIVHEISAAAATNVTATDGGAVLVSVSNVSARPSQGGRVIVLVTSDIRGTTNTALDSVVGWAILQRSPAGANTWTQVGNPWRMMRFTNFNVFTGYANEVSDGGGGVMVPVSGGNAQLGSKTAAKSNGMEIAVAAANQWIDLPPSDGDYDYRVLFSKTDTPGTVTSSSVGAAVAANAEIQAISIKVAVS